MTIDEMPAGREMDVLVAELMGWTNLYNRFGNEMGYRPLATHSSFIPDYSADIAAAWEVIEKLHAAGRFMCLDALGFDGEKWRCFFAWTQIEKQQYPWIGEADTAPLAVCRAALKAVTP